MFDFSPSQNAFPVGIIIFNLLFLLVAIPIEAYIFNVRLQFDKKSSVYYAICTNFFSGALGWLICFLIEPTLPTDQKINLLNYVFFNIISPQIHTLLILLGFIAFFTTFLMKFIFLRLLVYLQQEQIVLLRETTQPEFPRRNSRRNYTSKLRNTNLVTTTLIGNSLSYSAIAIALFVINSVSNKA